MVPLLAITGDSFCAECRDCSFPILALEGVNMGTWTLKVCGVVRFFTISDNREGDAADLLVFVEGIDVGHATDVVDDGHEAGLEVGG